jgi:eukaryotic-like serine/threonine-protein kinase
MAVLAGRYQLLERVGEGGMSVVWRARDTELEREVAIKLLRSVVAADPAQSHRFHREARALAALASDRIVRIYDYVSSGDDSFLVMEYVAGENLAQATRGRLPLEPGEAAAYMQPVAQALAYAHARGVVHRDPARRRLSEISCLGPYDAAEGAIVCRDANSLRSRMSCWTSY